MPQPWTTTTPTKPGHYWWRQDREETPAVVLVSESYEGLMVMRYGYGIRYLSSLAKAFPESEWSGPLVHPE